MLLNLSDVDDLLLFRLLGMNIGLGPELHSKLLFN